MYTRDEPRGSAESGGQFDVCLIQKKVTPFVCFVVANTCHLLTVDSKISELKIQQTLVLASSCSPSIDRDADPTVNRNERQQSPL